MDVDKIAFYPRLLGILEALSESHFVALDLELSGVSSKQTTNRGRQSLQERYAETKQAAERYQILQVGLTCVREHDQDKLYTLKPYNFPINPSFEENLDLERIFSFQSGAVDFLLSHGFRMEEPFEKGVPYLSRLEEKLAKQKARDREDKGRFEDVQLPDNDVESVKFLDKVREEIKVWLRTKKPSPEWVNIRSRTKTWDNCQTSELTSFDRRLVHQLVRAEYPGLITIGRRDEVTIKHLDEAREAAVKKERRKKVRAQIARQTGFRWILEAMTGGSLHKIELGWFARDPSNGAATFYDKDDFSARFNRAAANLKLRRPVLVGHNVLTDLVYFYQCFVGDLPETVAEFQQQIHELFPVIVDTKYMATENCGNTFNPASSLEQIEEGLRVERVPRIEIHNDHPKYVGMEAFHEAGYDSYLTARVMILLSAKLEAAGTYVLDNILAANPPVGSEDDDYQTAPEDAAAINNVLDEALTPTQASQTATKQVSSPPTSPTSPTPGSAKRKKQKDKNAGGSKSRFSTKTLFDALADADDEAEQDSAITDTSLPTPSASSKLPAPVVGSGFALNPNARPFPPIPEANRGATKEAQEKEKKTMQKKNQVDPLMPPFESDFWRVYANKLRVFGTVERVLNLDPTKLG